MGDKKKHILDDAEPGHARAVWMMQTHTHILYTHTQSYIYKSIARGRLQKS